LAEIRRDFCSKSVITMAAKILIVDDEVSFRTGLRCYLQDEGYAVAEAEHGPAALAALNTEKPELVLLDLRMPAESGLEFLLKLREKSADIPVVMISGAGEMADVVASMRLGAYDFVLKPISDLRILGQIVSRGLDRLRLVRENNAYRTRLENMIAERTAQLNAANAGLQRKTIALEEILSTYHADSKRRMTRVAERIDQFVRPILDGAAAGRRELLAQFEAALAMATSESLDQLSIKLAALTPTELRVCEMVRRGLGSKEIAAAIDIAADTVETHRRNIRRKLHINNETVNLTSYLRQVFDDGAALEAPHGKMTHPAGPV
jgi:FixJ family two-component response regulator